MKPATDPTVDYKALVRDGYNRCAKAFAHARAGEAAPILGLLTDRLGAGAKVLDIGCGAGVPVSRALADRGFSVTGVDISEVMIGLARGNVPSGTFFCRDVMEAEFRSDEFDAAVAFYSVFHIPREHHAELFRRVHDWLRPGGCLLASFTLWNENGYTEEDFFGVTMYWSNFSFGEYKALLRDAGFELLEAASLGNGYNDQEQRREERHPLLFAQKCHS